MASLSISGQRVRMAAIKPLLKNCFRSPEEREWLQFWAKACDYSPTVVEDLHAWVSAEFYYGLFAHIDARDGDYRDEVRRATQRGFSRENLGTLHVLGRAFGDPHFAYSRYAGYLNDLQDIGRYELHTLGKGKATFSFTPNPTAPSRELDCAYRRGALEAIPTLWGLPAARISHTCCVATGDEGCIYDVSWVPLRRRRSTWWAAALGLLAGGIFGLALAQMNLLPDSGFVAGALIAPWPLLGYLVGVGRRLNRQIEDTSQLMNEEMDALDLELKNVWKKCEEIEKKAEEEHRIRTLFQKYVPSQVLDRVLNREEKSLFASEAVEVTVLFADLVGFTPYAERTEPDRVMGVINKYFSRFSDIVSAHGGVVDKYMGDNVMAVFGAPAFDPESPRKAVSCARQLLKAVKKLNRQTELSFQLRIGLHHGPAVAGHVGSAERVNYTVMGDTVNLAQRLQAAAAPDAILLSHSVRKRCEDGKTFKRRGAITVRGRKSETSIYERNEQ